VNLLQPSEFRDLVSGRRRGPVAMLLRGALRVVEVGYAQAMRWRNWRYDQGKKEIVHVDVPVISVGNLTLGGTGKTPLVEWLAQWYRRHDVRVAIVSRGYGAEEGSRNDEAMELEQRLPDVPHVQNPDRADAARVAIEELECQLIVLDDGFQHRRLARDLDIVLVDALEPLGFGHVFPRGTLREPLSGLARADVILLSRADMLTEPERRAIRTQLERFAPDASWGEVTHAPRRLLSASRTEQPLEHLRGRRVAAFCGLGNPSGFRHTLERSECQVVAFREFPDHHAYSREDVDALGRWAGELEVEMVICTHKDLVKLGSDRLGARPLWALAIELEFLAGQAELETHLETLLPLA
jgi:tetraacyldisaccharide 4'-kinase